MASDRRHQEVQNREQEVWRLRVSGLTQMQVAERAGITQAAVSQILARVGDRLAQEFVEDARAYKVQQTQVLEAMAVAAWEQWQRSCEDAERETVVTGRVKWTEEGQAIPLPDQVTRMVEGQCGNPAL